MWNVLIISTAACLLYGIPAGIRSNFGIMLSAISLNSGVDYASVSFVMAVAQLMVGLVQPFAGFLALKKSNSFVMFCGIIMITAGLIAIPFCHSVISLMLALGILLPAGVGALAFGVIMGAITPSLGEERAAIVSGFVSASAGLGSTVAAPLMQLLISLRGLAGMLFIFCAPVLLMLPIIFFLSRTEQKNSPVVKKSSPVIVYLKDKSYIFITLAFFTCGFHMCIIETHLFSQYVSWGISEQSVAFAFSVYGIAAILGCIFTGWLDSIFPQKIVLGCTYASRIFIAIILLYTPHNLFNLYITAALFGFTGNATVPPTSGLLTALYGSENLAMLFGISYLSHQAGAFISSWLGGVLIQSSGDYSMIWLISSVLSFGAAALSFKIYEKISA